MTHKPPSLVIFDCDGVMVDSEPITNRLLAEDLTRHGLALSTRQAIDLFVGGTMKSVYAKAKARGADLPDDWVERFYDIMCDGLAAEITAIPDMHSVLDTLDANAIPYCVASNGPMRKMEITLGQTGMWDRCHGRIFSAHDVGIAKPDPGLFLHAARAMQTDAADCVIIEDSASGALAAARANIRCFGFCADTPADRLTKHGAVPFNTMAALPALLGI